MIKYFLISSVLFGCLSGCANKVYFGTSTRLAIDFSADGAGIGYKSSQFAIVPPRKKGDEFSVLGSSDVDISISNILIDEEFATGLAAEHASKNVNSSKAFVNTVAPHGNLLFGAYTTVSLVDINFGATNPFQGATFGYKRATATAIPILNDSLRSVYAKSLINSEDHSATNPCGTKTGGIRFVQLFATGQASINLAKRNTSSLEAVQTLDTTAKKAMCDP